MTRGSTLVWPLRSSALPLAKMSSIIGISSPFPLFPPLLSAASRCFPTAVFQAKPEPLQRDSPNRPAKPINRQNRIRAGLPEEAGCKSLSGQGGPTCRSTSRISNFTGSTCRAAGRPPRVIPTASSRRSSPARSTRPPSAAAAPGCCASRPASTPPRRSCTNIGKRFT